MTGILTEQALKLHYLIILIKTEHLLYVAKLF